MAKDIVLRQAQHSLLQDPLPKLVSSARILSLSKDVEGSNNYGN